MRLEERLRSLVDLSDRWKTEGRSVNEAVTKATFIEPVLESLRWDVRDPDEVDREHPVFGGTYLDYALRLEARPVLYLEAKPLRASLNDPQFITQTVNYANNDGVRWCVLTNGLVYRIYKSDELAAANDKLLIEGDIRDISDANATPSLLRALSLLGKDSVASGRSG